MRARHLLGIGILAPLVALIALSPGLAGATPGTTTPPDPAPTTVPAAAPAPSTTVAASGEDTGLGPEVSSPAPNAPPMSVPHVQSAPIVSLPAGCPSLAASTVVFIGTVHLLDFRTAQFTVRSVRAGTLDGFAVGDQVQVRYNEDARFLDVGTTYIVGATPDPKVGLLTSKVRELEPLFGGDAVAGVDDSDVKCPTVEDPVMTLTEQATPIDAGMLSPLGKAKGALLMAVLRPFAIAMAVLIGLVLIKHLVFAVGRSLRANTVTERPIGRTPRTPRARPAPSRRNAVRRARSGPRRATRTAERADPPGGDLVPSSAGAAGSGEAGA